MRSLFFLSLCSIFFFSGCSQEEPTPPSHQEIEAKSAIETNRTDAKKAQNEYLALQRKRKAEERL